MLKRRVLLLGAPSLLAEGVERLLRQLEDVEVIGPWDLNAQRLPRLSEVTPDIIVVAEESAEVADTGSLTSQVLEQHPDLTIVRIGMQQNTIRLYTSRALPARTTELVDLIRSLPLQHLEETEPKV